MNNFGDQVAFIWGVADLLRDSFKRAKYPDVILPLIVLRRPGCVLGPAKPKVVEAHRNLMGRLEHLAPNSAGPRASPSPTRRRSRSSGTLQDHAHLAANLRAYIPAPSRVRRECRGTDSVRPERHVRWTRPEVVQGIRGPVDAGLWLTPIREHADAWPTSPHSDAPIRRPRRLAAGRPSRELCFGIKSAGPGPSRRSPPGIPTGSPNRAIRYWSQNPHEPINRLSSAGMACSTIR